VTLGLGDFSQGTTSADRESFGIEWTRDGMRLTDQPIRDHPELLGDFVPRRPALNGPLAEHLWHVADHVVIDDDRLGRVREWLNAGE